MRNVLEAAIGRQAWRLREVDKPTLEQLRTLDPEDLDPVALEGPTPATVHPNPLSTPRPLGETRLRPQPDPPAGSRRTEETP